MGSVCVEAAHGCAVDPCHWQPYMHRHWSVEMLRRAKRKCGGKGSTMPLHEVKIAVLLQPSSAEQVLNKNKVEVQRDLSSANS